ncbi:MAG: PQQ-binding-like beta-propeller repeat protein [Pirellula sp.]|jgi:outer membrane protein assembly factor BamB
MKGGLFRCHSQLANPSMYLDTLRATLILTVLFSAQIVSSQELTRDWPQWGGSSYRNNAPISGAIPSQFDIETGENILWSASLGSETYGNPVVANGKIFVGTNNGSGFVERLPPDIDLGVLVCLNEADGMFLWQHSSEKLASGRSQDWPNIGICCSPLVENDRLWYVTSRGEVVCLDTDGFFDGENDGPIQSEDSINKNEADVVWRFDMMQELGISQHNMCSSSVTASGNRLFVLTGNGIDGDHKQIPAPNAPSFICLDRSTGKLLWADSSPGENILHGQWSSPACGMIGGVEQVVFAGGDGWIYSFDPKGKSGADGNGMGNLLWKFDANSKDSAFSMRNATRLHPIGTPVIYDDHVFVALGEDPEHGEGPGVLWAIDGTKRGDVSPTILVNASGVESVPRRRIQAIDRAAGELEKPNPNSAALWKYQGADNKERETTLHRSCATVAIAEGFLVAMDSSGIAHCLDVKTGKPFWTHDLEAASWSSPLIADKKIYLGDEDGDLLVVGLDEEKKIIAESNVGSTMYTTPIVADGILYVASRKRLFAIGEKK